VTTGEAPFDDDRTHRMQDFAIALRQILDRAGCDRSPDELASGLERRGTVSTLTPRLDDAHLPLPYVIDPGVRPARRRPRRTGQARPP